MGSTIDKWKEGEAIWVGPREAALPAGYLPLFGVRLTATTNDYDTPGAGKEGLAVTVTKPARTLSANRVIWEEEQARRANEMSEDLRESFELWTKKQCQGRREMMDRVANLFLYIFRQSDWEELIRWIDRQAEQYLRGALSRLLEGEGEEAVTRLGDRILESEDVFALQISAFGLVGVKSEVMEEVVAAAAP